MQFNMNRSKIKRLKIRKTARTFSPILISLKETGSTQPLLRSILIKMQLSRNQVVGRSSRKIGKRFIDIVDGDRIIFVVESISPFFSTTSNPAGDKLSAESVERLNNINDRNVFHDRFIPPFESHFIAAIHIYLSLVSWRKGE